jgi:cell division protein FtsL
MSPADLQRVADAARRSQEERDDTVPLRRPQPQPPQHLQLVPRQRLLGWRRRRRAALGVVVMAVTGMCFALVGLHVLIAENQFRLNDLQQEAATQQSQYEKLRLQVSQLEAPERIVSIAEGRLGMVQPGSVTYLRALPATSGPSQLPSAPGAGPSSGGDHASRAGTTVPAPSGDADWPGIKPYLSSNP